jgi:hypothetical protein
MAGLARFLVLAAGLALAAPAQDGLALAQDGPALAQDGPALAQDGPALPCAAENLPSAYLANPELAPPAMVHFQRSTADLFNPERGFVDSINVLGTSDYSWYRSQGVSLLWSYVRLDAYRNAPLDATFLANLDAALARVRAGGVKVFLRFTYNFSGSDPDAPRSVILNHISQLAPVLNRYADVIAFMQAGFIGAWGEWHNSTNGLDNTTDRRDILFALLDALPRTMMVQIRYPLHKSQIFNTTTPLTPAQAFTRTNQARVGFHNDCFLADSSDGGTYPSGGTDWKAYLAQDGRFDPVGGETCSVDSPRSDCPTAQGELRMLHFSWLNRDYHPEVIASWKNQGCYAPIAQQLGYRFVLNSATFSQVVRAGQPISLQLNLVNEGYAAMYNSRPVVLVLDNAGSRIELPLPVAAADPRRWEAGSIQVNTSVTLPASTPAGCYRLSVWLPDPAPGLARNPLYAVQFANVGIWDAGKGFNVLAPRFPVLAP